MAYSVQQLEKNISYLKYANAQMAQQLFEADALLRRVGFDNGLETVKETAKEMIRLQSRKKEEGEDSDLL